MSEKDWYIIDNVEELDSPSLVVYPERIRYNIDLLKSMIDDPARLRPHIKTHKNPQVTALLIEAGITKFKCATIAEAEMLGMCKATDVLLAYQPVGPKLERFVKLIGAYPDTMYSCLTDNATAANAISALAVEMGLEISVYIDLNVGMNRTGIEPGKGAIELYRLCDNLAGIKPVGLHAYDGHIHDSDLQVREQKSNLIFNRLMELKAELQNFGFEPEIIAGGSPTTPYYSKKEGVICSPGTFVYWDYGYKEAFKEQPFLPAAVLIARVVSLPDETKICIDLGHKSVAAENVLAKRVFFLNAAELIFTGHSEEHLIADAGEDHSYKVGDVLYGLPYHICPTVAEYERVSVIENKRTAGEWKNIARDRKITI